MDRQITYPGQIPLDTDLLNTNKNAMVALAALSADVFGTITQASGLACTPSTPAALTVQVGAGRIYSLQNIDGTAYSSLAADTTHQILKQGILLDPVTLACAAPTTVGYSINYLIQAAYQDSDTNLVTLPYYNASNPTQAYQGPAGNGTSQATARKGIVVLSAKAGIAATTGTQTTPAADVGYVGLYSVTVAYGQTTITAPNISTLSGAPFVTNFSTLASTTSANGGAGQVGFGYALAYAAGTVGKWLKDLALAAGSTFIGWIQAGTGAVLRTLSDKARESVSVLDFGADPTGVADSTTAIQNWINYLSNNPQKKGYAPAGKYNFTRLYAYYDAALNAGFSQTFAGRILIEGDGQMIDAEANGWPGAGATGTVFICTSTTGDGFVISPNAYDSGTYPSRNVRISRMSFVMNSTGFVIRQAASPWSKLREVTVLQLNAGGNGIYWHSSWFGAWSDVYVTNAASSGQTGKGVDFGSSLFAGIFIFTRCVWERFSDGFVAGASAGSAVLVFNECTAQSNANAGTRISAGYRSITFKDYHAEFNGVNHLLVDSTAAVSSLVIEGGFMLGGSTTATTMTGPMVKLQSVTNYAIKGLSVFRPWTNVIDITYFAANGTRGSVKNCYVDASDNTPPANTRLISVNDQRAVPVMEDNVFVGSANITEYDTATYLPSARIGLGVESFAWNQPVQKTTLGLNASLVLQSVSAAPVQVLNVTGIGSFVSLPGLPGQGRKIVIANQVSSTTTTVVRQSDQVTNLITLAAGQSAICYYEPAAAKWVAIGPLAFVGL